MANQSLPYFCWLMLVLARIGKKQQTDRPATTNIPANPCQSADLERSASTTASDETNEVASHDGSEGCCVGMVEWWCLGCREICCLMCVCVCVCGCVNCGVGVFEAVCGKCQMSAILGLVCGCVITSSISAHQDHHHSPWKVG